MSLWVISAGVATLGFDAVKASCAEKSKIIVSIVFVALQEVKATSKMGTVYELRHKSRSNLHLLPTSAHSSTIKPLTVLSTFSQVAFDAASTVPPVQVSSKQLSVEAH